MHRFLTLRLCGVMASWGEIAVGSQRGSADHPTRSALLGLVGAALGVRRDDLDTLAKLALCLHFAVRVDVPGVLMRDYQTTRVCQPGKHEWFSCRRDSLRAKNVHCVPSERYYYSDTHYTVVAWLDDNLRWTLEDLATALHHPVFVLFLGRKACPLGLPPEARVLEAPTLRDAFAAAQYTLPEGLQHLQPAHRAIYWEDTGEIPTSLTVDHVFDRPDNPLLRSPRHFTPRREYHTTENAQCT